SPEGHSIRVGTFQSMARAGQWIEAPSGTWLPAASEEVQSRLFATRKSSARGSFSWWCWSRVRGGTSRCQRASASGTFTRRPLRVRFRPACRGSSFLVCASITFLNPPHGVGVGVFLLGFGVRVGEGVLLGVGVGVGVAVGGTGVVVGVGVGATGVFVGVRVGVGATGVFVGVRVGVAVGATGVFVGVGVGATG